jgi:hypothetical protein
MSGDLDPKSPSMALWLRLLAAGVSEDEARTLMNGYAHELAGQQRNWDAEAAGYTDPQMAVYAAADLIDPETDDDGEGDGYGEPPPVGEYRISTR